MLHSQGHFSTDCTSPHCPSLAQVGFLKLIFSTLTSPSTSWYTYSVTTVPWMSRSAKLGIGFGGYVEGGPAGVGVVGAAASGNAGGSGFGGSGVESASGEGSVAGGEEGAGSAAGSAGGAAGEGVQSGENAPVAEPGFTKKRESYSNASNLRARRSGKDQVGRARRERTGACRLR